MAINDLIHYPSLELINRDDNYTIKLNRDIPDSRSIDINRNNIQKITVSDEWARTVDFKKNNIVVDFSGYIEIDLLKRQNYDQLTCYVDELMIFMQLYYYDKFHIDKIQVEIDDKNI